MTCRSCGIVASCMQKCEEIGLFEAATLNIAASIHCHKEGLLSQLKGELLLNVFNSIKSGWEPVIERWPINARLEFLGLGEEGPSSAASGQVLLGIKSAVPLEITAGLSLTKALRAAEAVFTKARLVSAHPARCSADVHGPESALGMLENLTFDLYNYTGLDVEFWLHSESKQASPPKREGAHSPLGVFLSPSSPSSP